MPCWVLKAQTEKKKDAEQRKQLQQSANLKTGKKSQVCGPHLQPQDIEGGDSGVHGYK